MELSWTADITETDSFALYREGEGQALAQLEKGQTSYQDTSAISGATNSYYLIAKNTHGQTSSNTLGVAVPACPLPLKAVLSAHSDQCDSVALSWNADVTHTQSFELLRMDSGTTTPVSVATPSLSARELVDTNNLDAATSYSYTLRAINDHGYTDSLVALASTPNCMVPEPESKPDQIPNSQEPTQSETGSSGGGTSSIWFLILLAGLLGQRRRFV